MSRSWRDPPGTFNPKVNQKTVPDTSTGFEYENTLSQPLNRVKKTGFFGLECLSPDFFSVYLIGAANNKIYFCNKISQKCGGFEWRT
jgi:hypothetical protein